MSILKIRADSEDLHQLRFAYSPLAELSISYQLLKQSKHYHHAYRVWIEQTTRALDGVELPYMDALLTGGCGYIPDFLTPTPQRMSMSLDEELEQLFELPDAIIRDNVQTLILSAGESQMRQQFLVYPREMVLCLIEEIRFYWQRALLPHYQRMISILEGDVLYRARQLAVDGAAAMFSDLHPTLKLKDNYLVLHKDRPFSNYYPEFENVLKSSGLQLVPSIFSASKLHWQFAPNWQPMLMYGVRGLGMWEQQAPQRNYSLELTLGEGRARVLQAVMQPASTGELAQRLEVSAGGVSQHLARLSEAGLVESHRSGKHVFYQLTPRGTDLLALFDSTT